jgi:bifunctional UDP-N-acetylglucosamine pyrophosphorylase/glucosamine-1-phosphate N-acetyltransferase/UDP-N-acetylglucosamine pyrophosphorylase
MDKFVDSVVVVILAAGKGTRMRSDKAKVLHRLNNRPMIMYVLQTALEISGNDIVVVVGNQADEVQKVVSDAANVSFAFQKEQKGTGHAVKCAMEALPHHCEQVVILSGDVPLIQPTTIRNLISDHVHQKNDITVLAVCLENPFGYGRIVTNAVGGVEKIVEETDANDREKAIKIVNSGIYCVDKGFLAMSLSKVTPNNNQKEIYLTDVVGVAHHLGREIGLMICGDQREVMGINTPQDLMNIEAMLMEK